MMIVDVRAALNAVAREQSPRRNLSMLILLPAKEVAGSFYQFVTVHCPCLLAVNGYRRFMACLVLFSVIGFAVPSVQADEGLDNYNVAVGLFRQARWKDAAEQFREFTRVYIKHEKAPLARFYLGLTLEKLEDYKEAREELRKFANENRQSPNLGQARYRIGECSYLMDDLAAARIELEGFVKDFPNDSMREHALPYLGDTELRLNEPTAALKMFESSIDQFPQGKLIDDAKFGRARALESLKRTDEAARQFQELAAQKEGVRAPDAQFHLAAIYFERKQFAAAAVAYLTLTKDFSTSSLVPSAQLNAGYALYQSGKFTEAAQQFEQAARDESQHLTASYWRGRSLKAMGDYAPAAEILRKAAQAAGSQPLAESILFEQALCERYLQHPVESRALFEQVLTRFPKGNLADDSLHSLIEMSIESGELATAEQLLARFQTDYPQSGLRLHFVMLAGRLDLARAGLKLREDRPATELNAYYDTAVRQFEQVMTESSIPKTKGQARYYLALSRQLQGNQAQAVELISPLADQALIDGEKSDFADAVVLQAESLYQERKYELAGGSATKYLSTFPKGRQTARALSIQALAAENRNEPEVAKAALVRLGKEFPDHPLTLLTTQNLAELAETRGDWVTAGRLYEAIADLQKDPEKQAYAVRGLALSQYEQKDYSAAAKTFGRIVSEFPRHSLVPECTYYCADSLKKSDQTEEAIALFAELFETFRGDIPAKAGAELESPLIYPWKAGLQVARLLGKAGKVVEADAAYAALLQRFPEPVELDKRLDEWAILNYQDMRYEQADAIWRRLLKDVPLSPLVNNAKLSLAESDLIASKFEEARQVFEELAESDKSTDEVKEQSLYQLVVLAVDQQRWADVRVLGERLITRFPASPHRYYVRYSQAEAYLANPKPGEDGLASARESLQSLQAEGANDEIRHAVWFDRVAVLLAEVNFRERKYDEVVSVVNELRERNPKSQFLHQADEVLGRSYKQQAPPKFDDARAAFERVLLDPAASRTETAAKSQFMIGETYFLQKKWKPAFLAYQKVYSNYKFPEWQAAALLMSAKCDEAQEDWKSAVDGYKRLIQEFPASSVTNDAKANLEAAQKRVGS